MLMLHPVTLHGGGRGYGGIAGDTEGVCWTIVYNAFKLAMMLSVDNLSIPIPDVCKNVLNYHSP